MSVTLLEFAFDGGYTWTVERPSTATFVSNLVRGGADSEKAAAGDMIARAASKM